MITISKTISAILALTYLTYATYMLIAMWANWTIPQHIITIVAMSGLLAISNYFFEQLKK